MQRGGRGGRGGESFCRCTILIQPSVTTISNKCKHGKESGLVPGSEELPAVVYRKSVEEAFRRFLTSSDECLWKIVDEHYNNPPREGTLNIITILPF